MSKTYVFHMDAGHGWLAVKRAELISLGIIDKVSSYSYQSVSGKTVYLEEDCDAPLFYKAMKAKDRDFQVRESYKHNSHVRNLDNFML